MEYTALWWPRLYYNIHISNEKLIETQDSHLLLEQDHMPASENYLISTIHLKQISEE